MNGGEDDNDEEVKVGRERVQAKNLATAGGQAGSSREPSPSSAVLVEYCATLASPG